MSPSSVSNKKSLVSDKSKLLVIAVVAIAIIALVTAWLYWTEINNIRARNAERIIGVSKIKKALEEYHKEFGRYPKEGYWCSLEETDPSSDRYCGNLKSETFQFRN